MATADLTVIGLGTWAIGGPWQYGWGPQDDQASVQTIRAALEAGVNWIDTAPIYGCGHSELVVGQALKGLSHKPLVATKCGLLWNEKREKVNCLDHDSILRECEQSLRRLGVETIDLYQVHWPVPDGQIEEAWEAMAKLVEQGKVRFLGISELSEGDGTHAVLRRAVPTGAFDIVMLTINVLLQTAADELLPLCRKHDVGTVVMMPLNQASKQSGLVSVPAALACVRRHIAARNLPAALPYTDARLFDFLRPYSIPEAALRFVLAHDIGACCVGARSPERVQENLQAVQPPYMNAVRLEHLRTLFGSIRTQIR